MSEHSQGPGWWLASDGKWYPPESAPSPPPPGPAKQVTIPQRERLEWAALAGAAALVIGSFMAWATAGPFRVPGTDGDGWITIVLGCVAGYMSWQRKYRGAALAAGLGVIVVMWKLSDLSALADDNDFIAISPGSGLYVCGIGGSVCVITSLLRWSDVP